MNPERVSVLDVDFDIEGSKRNDVLNLFRKNYGEDRVANVATFRTEKSKSAILTACLAPGTKINTNNGLKNIETITSKDFVYTTNGLEKVITPTTRYYNGDLFTFNCSGIGEDFSVTHNHQLLVYTNRQKLSYGPICNYKRNQLIDPQGNSLGEFLSIKEASLYYEKNYNGSYSSLYKYKKHNGYTIKELSEIENHKIQWLSADQIKESDYLLTPIYDKRINSPIYFNFSKDEQNPYKKSCAYINENIKLDENLSELIGIYLAEGNINHNYHGITFTINQNEGWLKNRIEYLVKTCFGLEENNFYYYNKKGSEALSIQVNSTPLGRWFNKYCPGLAINKKVPSQIFLASKDIQKRLLYGCFYGDGYGRLKNNLSYEAKITSISFQLIQDLWQIAAINGYNCSTITEERRQKRRSAYNLMFYGSVAETLTKSKYENIINYNWEKEDYIYYNNQPFYKIKINKINSKKYSGTVFCIETLSHNYLLNNIVSHNCRGLGIDVDIAQYLAGLVPADRGQLRTLEQCMYGDSENDLLPIRQFVHEMSENYPEVWRVAQAIEGLICGSGVHAGGVIFVDEPFTKSCSLMRAPDGTICTNLELHDCEDVS